MSDKPRVRIEDWSTTSSGQDHVHPELRDRSLHGKVYGHPSFDGGECITSSSLVSMDLKNKLAESRNTIFELGAIDPEFEKYCEETGFYLTEKGWIV